MDGVAHTSLLVAALRANETKRDDRLFEDPFADALAGDSGYRMLAEYRAAAGSGIPIIEVRTRYYDDALARTWTSGIRQFVIVASGMDARAWRLPWPRGSRVFELDQPDVLAHKESVLAKETPRCERISRPVDLREDWTTALTGAGFDPKARTVWMLEGLLQYLPPAAVEALASQSTTLSAPGSVVLYDVVGERLLASPIVKPAMDYMANLGAPWIFGTDDPGGLWGVHGWDAVVTDAAVLGNSLGRWPYPAIPQQVRVAPRGYLITATKR